VAALLSPGCPAGPSCDLALVAEDLATRWPDAGAARDDRHVWETDAVWYWSHGTHSVDGFGVTMVVLEHAPRPDAVFDHIDPVTDGLGIERPNLLFFDRTDGVRDEWPLIGFGYTTDYLPCESPAFCSAELSWEVHEAGYHRVIAGDGGMTLATSDDLIEGAASAAVDADGCEPVWLEDLEIHGGTVRHGRMWTVHVWIDPEGGPPVVARTDPWRRWEDAPDRVSVDADAFFVPNPEACDCDYGGPTARGCG